LFAGLQKISRRRRSRQRPTKGQWLNDQGLTIFDQHRSATEPLKTLMPEEGIETPIKGL